MRKMYTDIISPAYPGLRPRDDAKRRSGSPSHRTPFRAARATAGWPEAPSGLYAPSNPRAGATGLMLQIGTTNHRPQAGFQPAGPKFRARSSPQFQDPVSAGGRSG
jgi:hypothetical protein